MNFSEKPASQYEQATRSGALIDLSARGKIEVNGSDRVNFLHRMLTNDIAGLKPGSGCYACLLSAQAKVTADMNVWITEKNIILGVEPGFAPKTIQALEKFIVMDDVQLKDTSADLAGFGIVGPNAEKLIQKISSNHYPKEDFRHAPLSIDGIDGYVMCLPLFQKKSWYIAVKTDRKSELSEKLKKSAREFGIGLMDEETAEILRVESGTPRYGVDVTEETLLPEVPFLMSRAVSFTKGCYPGQEIVARMDSRAKFAKQFAGIAVEGSEIPKKGDVFESSGKKAGFVTSAVFSPKLGKPLALGYLFRDYLDSDKLEVNINNSIQKAQIVNFPY